LNARGYRLIAEGCICDDDCWVKAICSPEMKKDQIYSILVSPLAMSTRQSAVVQLVTAYLAVINILQHCDSV